MRLSPWNFKRYLSILDARTRSSLALFIVSRLPKKKQQQQTKKNNVLDDVCPRAERLTWQVSFYPRCRHHEVVRKDEIDVKRGHGIVQQFLLLCALHECIVENPAGGHPCQGINWFALETRTELVNNQSITAPVFIIK